MFTPQPNERSSSQPLEEDGLEVNIRGVGGRPPRQSPSVYFHSETEVRQRRRPATDVDINNNNSFRTPQVSKKFNSPPPPPSECSTSTPNDSGFVESSSPLSSTSFRINNSSDDLWSEVSSPFIEIRRKWKRRSKSLFSSTMMDEMEEFTVVKLLPIILAIIILSSGVFMVQMVTRQGNNNNKLNGKYASIEFAFRRIQERTNSTLSTLDEIKDETGKVLGGKKASIQFSYELRQLKKDQEEEKTEEPSKVDTLSSSQNGGLSSMDAERRKELLKKLSEFGFFTTSQVATTRPEAKEESNKKGKEESELEPLDIEEDPHIGEKTKSKRKTKRRRSPSYLSSNDPFSPPITKIA